MPPWRRRAACDLESMTPWRPWEVLQHRPRGTSYRQSATLVGQLFFRSTSAVANRSLSPFNQLLDVHQGEKSAQEILLKQKSSSLRLEANQISPVSVQPDRPVGA